MAFDRHRREGCHNLLVVINAYACLAFSLVVIVGGIYDLKFLLSALKVEEIDESDDGRVEGATEHLCPKA